MPNYNNPSILERLVALGTYLSGGLIGIIWFILLFFLKRDVSSFLKYHITQSIVFFLFLYVINLFFSIVFGFLTQVPFIKGFTKAILFFFQTPIYFGFSIVGALISIIVLYMGIGALLGKYSYIPFLSDAINSRRS